MAILDISCIHTHYITIGNVSSVTCHNYTYCRQKSLFMQLHFFPFMILNTFLYIAHTNMYVECSIFLCTIISFMQSFSLSHVCGVVHSLSLSPSLPLRSSHARSRSHNFLTKIMYYCGRQYITYLENTLHTFYSVSVSLQILQVGMKYTHCSRVNQL